MFASDAEDAELKVVDFGFARLKPREGEDGMRTPCFTLQYAAPEVLDQSGLTSGQAIHGSSQSATSPPSNALKSPSDGYNESCDLWSLGVILVSPELGSQHLKAPNSEASSIQFKFGLVEFRRKC